MLRARGFGRQVCFPCTNVLHSQHVLQTLYNIRIFCKYPYSARTRVVRVVHVCYPVWPADGPALAVVSFSYKG